MKTKSKEKQREKVRRKRARELNGLLAVIFCVAVIDTITLICIEILLDQRDNIAFTAIRFTLLRSNGATLTNTIQVLIDRSRKPHMH